MKNIYFLVAYLAPFFVFGEGSKEIGNYFRTAPNATDGGFVLANSTDGTYTNFGQYGAASEFQIKIAVEDTSELIHYGLNPRLNTNGNLVSMPYRIVDPEGNVVFESQTPALNQAGYIPNFTQAENGPNINGRTNGYNSLTYKPTMVGDYVIEFNPPAALLNNDLVLLRYFDVTVVDSTNQVALGRLHSQAWQLSSGSYTQNPVTAVVYPYHPNGVVYEVDFNGIRPFVFSIFFNSSGTDTTGDILLDRQSQIGYSLFPEYKVFLNPPDETLYPTYEQNLEYTSSVTRRSCQTTLFCIEFNSEHSGIVDGFIDFNGNSLYEPDLGDILFADFLDSTGSMCVEWDGLDGNGDPVENRNINIISQFGSGIMHLPMYDIEHNPNGYIVRTHSPTSLPDPLIFWDDTKITDGSTLGSPKVELNGCQSSSAGCHQWINRGQINGTRALQETINTWWFSDIRYDTIRFDNNTILPIRNSYEQNTLNKTPQMFCPGDSVSLFVFEDGIEHYDSVKYLYSWYQEATLIDTGVAAIRIQVLDSTYIFTEAVSRTDNRCFSRDSILVITTDSIRIESTVIETFCEEGGSIDVALLQSPPNPVFTWSTGETTQSLTNLASGTYTLNIVDINFPNCSFDTSFSIVDTVQFELDTIMVDTSRCFNPNGSIRVSMLNKSYAYEYAWNNSSFVFDDSAKFGLSAGNYDISVQIVNRENCRLDTTIFLPTITSLPVELSFENTVLNKGPITICPGDSVASFIFEDGIDHPNSAKYRYTWQVNQLATANPSFGFHKAYFAPTSIAIRATLLADTVCVSRDTIHILTIDSVKITHLLENAFCQSTGMIEVQLTSSPPNPIFMWSSTPEDTNRVDSLSAGSYTLRIEDPEFPNCSFDTTFTITDTTNFGIRSFSFDSSWCFNPTGNMSVEMMEPNYSYVYVWDNNVPTTEANYTNVSVGLHSLIVSIAGYPSCVEDTSVFIPSNFLDFISDYKNDLCSQNKGQIRITALSENASIIWNDGSSAGFNRPNLGEGIYSFTMINSIDPSCRVDTFIAITDSNYTLNPEIGIEEKEFYRAEEEIRFFAVNDTSNWHYIWHMLQGTVGEGPSLNYIFPQRGEYSVGLIAIDSNGCRGATITPIFIIDPIPCKLALPTAFSPNGDNYNDELNLLGKAFNIDLQIYNRWGEVIFRSYSVEESWDGSYRNESTMLGVYPYILRYECPDGEGNMKKYKLVGDITLTR